MPLINIALLNRNSPKSPIYEPRIAVTGVSFVRACGHNEKR